MCHELGEVLSCLQHIWNPHYSDNDVDCPKCADGEMLAEEVK